MTQKKWQPSIGIVGVAHLDGKKGAWNARSASSVCFATTSQRVLQQMQGEN